MQEALVLVGEIFLIICIQTVFEVFVDTEKKSNASRIMNIACFIGCVYILIQFVFQYFVNEIVNVLNITSR